MKKTIIYITIALAAFCSCDKNSDKPYTVPEPDERGSFVDERDGTEYAYVKYGNLEWMTSNLRFDGVKGGIQPNMDATNPRYYDDGQNIIYFNRYGFLYDLETAKTAVPDGWRLPTGEDWNNLESTVGTKAMREAIGLQYGGYYLPDEKMPSYMRFTEVYAYYWEDSIDESKPIQMYAFYRKFIYNQDQFIRESMNKANLLSVRCVRNAK